MNPIGPTQSVLSNTRLLGSGAPDLSSVTKSAQTQSVSFNEILASHTNAASKGPTRAEQARTSSEQLVATTFIKPILSKAREMSNAPAPFAPTQGEKQFGALLDNKIADSLVSKMNLSIVDRIASTLIERIPEDQRNEQAQAGMDLIG